jgi:MATE family multidrug resistance protein
MLSINTDILLRTLCVVSMHAFFMAKSAQLGDLTLAANQVLHNFLLFTSFGLDGVANASEAILGEAVGRRDRDGFRRSMRVVLVSAGFLALGNVAVYALAGHGIIALLTGIPEVRAAAGAYLIWPVLLPLVSVWAYTYDGVYLAATRTAIMRNAVMAAFIAFLTLLYTLFPVYGNTGLWIALTAYLGLRGLLLHLCIHRVLRVI